MASVFCSITLVTDMISSLISLGGQPISNSERIVDFQDFEACRHQYAASTTIAVRIEYSKDFGVSWQVLIDEYSMTGASLKVSGWQVIPDDAKAQEVMIRAYATGSGLVTSVNFVEFQFR